MKNKSQKYGITIARPRYKLDINLKMDPNILNTKCVLV